MKVLDGVQRLLEEAGAPLHYEEITRRLLDRGLWTTKGRTPAATVNALLAVDIKKRGPASRFQRSAPGTFALNSDVRPARRSESRAGTVRKHSARTAKSLSFTDAAEEVLKRFGEQKPMHYREITAKALELGLLQTKGETPEATLSASILMEIQRQERRGEQPRFAKHGRGYIGLTRWMGRGLAHQIGQHNEDIRKKLHRRVIAMKPDEFEALVGRLLTQLGFESVEVTRHVRDGGVDVRGTLVVGDVVRTRMAVQAKKWALKKNVGAPVVQQVRGSLGAHEQGLIITTSDFSRGAKDEAERADATPVGLMNGVQLTKLLIENRIGVRTESHELLDLASLEPESADQE